MKNKKGAVLIFVVIMLVGVTLIAAGVMNVIRNKEYTKYYVETKGVLSGTDIYSSDYDGTTYSLIYEYVVDGEKYYISTDYGTGIIPKEGTTKTIRYNPDNPNEAEIAGDASNMIFFLIGFMFFTIPLVFIINEPSKTGGADKRKLKERITPILIGIIFVGVGIGAYILMCSAGDDLSLKSAFDTAGFVVAIPILFTLLGAYTVISSILPRKARETVVKVEDIIDGYDGSYNVIFADQTETLIGKKTGMYGRYTYNTNNVDRFSKDKKFKFNLYKYSLVFQMVPISGYGSCISLNAFSDEDFEETM